MKQSPLQTVILAMFFAVLFSQYLPASEPPVTVTRLRCEYLENPLAIDAPHPRLSWITNSDRRGEKQTAYQILVASTPEKLFQAQGDLWDSGKVVSDRQIQVEYAGKPLDSRQSCYWKVGVWDSADQVHWSEPALWTMGVLKPADWQGKWIGADNAPDHQPIYLRRAFRVTKPVKRAVVSFCGLGWSELSIGGKPVGDYVMAPGNTVYDKRVQYLTFNVTDHFQNLGDTTLDVLLFDGWYAIAKGSVWFKPEQQSYVDKPKLLLDLAIEYADGSKDRITSDTEWRWSTGPIQRSYLCEQDTDFRVVPKYDQPVKLVEGPKGALVSQVETPPRIVETVEPVSLSEKNGVWTFTFDREFMGFVDLKTSGPAGTRITLKTIQAIAGNGYGPKKFSCVLKGEGEEHFAPRQTYVTMQRVEVSGLARPPVLSDLKGIRISGVGVVSGDFSCSDETLNWLHQCARRSQANYVTTRPNDSTREFNAYSQDIQSTFWSAMWLFDSRTMYERWEYDFLDGQNDQGNFPYVCPPASFSYSNYNGLWWAGSLVWLPWEMWQRTGDDRLLRESYPGMKRYVDFLTTKTKNGLHDWGLDDWMAPEAAPRPIVNTPAAFLFAKIVSRTAEMLGKSGDATKYAQLAETILQKYNATFLDRATGIYGIPGWVCKPATGSLGATPKYPPLCHETWWTGDRPCTQAGQVMPLALGMVPEGMRPAVEQALVREIAAHDNHLSTGFVTTPYLLQVLADLAPDRGLAITTQRDFPSWYWMTKGRGNDIMKEHWNGGNAAMASCGGNIAAWNMEAVAGIRPDPTGPGFKRIIIKPMAVKGLTWAKGWYDSPYGRIAAEWAHDGKEFKLDLTIPPNTSATVFMPANDPKSIKEGGAPAIHAAGVKFLRQEKKRVVLALGSGTYHLVSPLFTGEDAK